MRHQTPRKDVFEAGSYRMRRIILKSFQSPGDVVMLTAAVRDLHAAYPGQFQIDVRTSADALWENNPHLSRLNEGMPGVEVMDMHYPLIHQSNQRPYHFLHGYTQFLEEQLGLRIPVTRFAGDIHLSPSEKSVSPASELSSDIPDHYWIMMAGGKFDFTAKWWNPASYQKVVDHFRGRITFIQCGESGHWHPPLKNVINLVGKTTTRQFVRLMYFADGVVCPVTFAMHLAAAVETRPGRVRHRPCVVIAGGREPAQWEAYPHHQYLGTNGMLSCCADGGCWKSRCQLVGDGDAKDHRDVCEQPVQLTPELRIPRCLDMISADDVIRKIEMYLQGGMVSIGAGSRVVQAGNGASAEIMSRPQNVLAKPVEQHREAGSPVQNVLLTFRHGLGDAVQFTSVLRHLQHFHPEWNVDVLTLLGKHSAFTGLCRRTYIIDRDPLPCCGYQQQHDLGWHESKASGDQWPSTKVTRCLLEVFQIKPVPELCRYQITPSAADQKRAHEYLTSICGQPAENGRFRAVLIHYEGNTSGEQKNLSHELAREICEVALASNYVPVILDWDQRSPHPDGTRIHNPGAGHPLWEASGTGDAATLAALIEASALIIGVDSGPLHVAGATSTPTIGVWTKHHPIHYFDLADNVLHFVPVNHSDLVAGQAALTYFDQNYMYRPYEKLEVDLISWVEHQLTGVEFEKVHNKRFLRQLNATGYTRDYYEEHKFAGLDYLGFGEWQQQYGRWMVQSLGYVGRRMLDVGCACGSILRGLGQAGAIVQGVDLCEPMIQLGREKWPDMAPLLFVCDAVNLHMFADQSWDGIHSAQVAEHWKPELVPFILRELARITTPGGLFFCALDTEELFARQGRTLEHEDPTHICIKPMTWWHDQLSVNGWEVCTDEWEPVFRRHPEDFLSRHDWDFFVARRKHESS